MSRPGKSADGQHWVYRLEGRRRCWFQVAEGVGRAKESVRYRAARHRAAKDRVAKAEEKRPTAPRRKAVADARAELQRSAPEDTSRPGPSAPVQVVDAGPVLATGTATRVSPVPLSKNDRLTANGITPRQIDVQIDVEALLAATPAASDVVAASATPLAHAEAGDGGQGWTWLGMLLMAFGLLSVLSASRTIRWAVLTPRPAPS
ncbi:hypothetical protein [Bradyrhizobium sp. CCGB20]|uniref:hypothetical protein n=1 Tax=Bradyrhizobium sp. CCGB20 TaxID=2949633 RepID=UPI0020B362B0|nr:hypothetical protein [Bradyrhizobium sp. CCGB20]MCP3397319.1 hypothetical protein [Bradyrhizobium sp. CCGB20]